ncbi:MAG: DeoR/GlpR transcriptional regulator [Candidatus Sumerlaeia bacterium]|nr:DeoR/GlpR transcriptional regulator [Candidatus Sumerlaeia bacterium]
MHALERRRRILEILAETSFLSVEEAEKKLGASPATIRRDYNELAHQGLVVRGHGGIHRLDNAPIMGVLPFSRRKVEHPEGKTRIAKAAAGLLKDGEIVIIDGGTTTVNLAQFLPQHVRVVTNSLPLASALNEPGNGRVGVPEVNMTGGYVYPRSEVLLGPQTVKSLAEYSADWTFLGAGGVTVDGIFNSNNLIVDTQRMMIERAGKLAILVDSTKFKGPAMMKVCELMVADYIVTDEKPPAELLEACKEHKVEVVVAK